MAWTEALDRRSHSRVRRQFPCRVWVAGEGRRGVVRNLSADGVHVEVQAELPPRTEVVVALDLPMGEPVLLSGATQPTRRAPHSLARIAAAGLTVRLHDPSPAYLRWLEAALREDAT